MSKDDKKTASDRNADIEERTKVQKGFRGLFMYVTHYFTGEVVDVTPTEYVLKDASWIPDTGRFHECIAKGTTNECEPCGDAVVRIPRPCIVVEWRHPLPLEVK